MCLFLWHSCCCVWGTTLLDIKWCSLYCMPEDKIAEIKDLAKKFVDELKKQDVKVKAWNVAVGKEGEATNIKISIEVNITSRKK